MRSIRCVVFGGYGTDVRQLTKKTQSIFDPSIPGLTHTLVPLQVADLFSRRGHERIHGMSSQYDIIHYTSASSFCLGTKCALENKTIILEGVPYLRNDKSLVRACFPTALHHHPLVEKVMRRMCTRTLDLMKFDDDWYAQYVRRIVHLGASNRVYVIHSQCDAISTLADCQFVLEEELPVRVGNCTTIAILTNQQPDEVPQEVVQVLLVQLRGNPLNLRAILMLQSQLRVAALSR